MTPERARIALPGIRPAWRYGGGRTEMCVAACAWRSPVDGCGAGTRLLLLLGFSGFKESLGLSWVKANWV
ncbi:hypothetical protein ES332_D13G060400v1 [Gossypium tomentosum]|uniref:Uncharacterized protein n=1 Tax=Gossypium tomentosum TaxID=34277 RepID=A0A5D2HTJ4_GOSTO|nr:hypothetical protein ES332_D13G060400v1 [Gossypium tomentosum]